ncbi:LacI family DNA-binding transcriptional regulator [Arthrobacter sp. JZ12]|uniref:LacI family DNA-binding transcriptional regulator n=1 Tax=Arthrobacter sp. JZ12 TaxID=2654190 RepID=UPI002B47C212|nr:LacI family DNA-binding transcriptional regulator [Arthrobacter sp. JZ12]WRH25163.1 LacI family DNA-binding transcriptional regulator [Arthrobacter sp. JZ12]
MTEPKRPTLRDIANAAGLSKAATSYALRGLRGSDKTVARVRAIAEEMGWTADPVARALAGGPSGNVAILGSLSDLWRQGLAVMLSEALHERGMFSAIADVDTSPERERDVLLSLPTRRVDAAIVLPVDPSAAYWADVPERIRLVSVGDALPLRPAARSVLFDNEFGISTALEHLAGLGHRRVGLLTPSLPSTPGRPAQLLVERLGEAMGLRISVASSRPSVAGASEAARALLTGETRPTALFCLSDSLAFGAYSAARSLGLAVPEELSIMGFDDSELAPLVSPELTSFGWDESAIVAAAVRGVADEHAPPSVMFRPDFLVRGSTSPARQP